MSNITSYPGIRAIEPDDLMVISDVSEDGNPTRTVSIASLKTTFGDGGGGGTSGNILGIYPINVATTGLNTTVSIAGGVLQDKITLTTNGTSGRATLNGGALNIPQYSTGTSQGTDQVDRFILTGMLKNLMDSRTGTGAVTTESMEWTSGQPKGESDQLYMWRTPVTAKLKLVTWCYTGADLLNFPTDNDKLVFQVGTCPNGVDPIIANFAGTRTMFELNRSDDKTRPQGQIDVSDHNIILDEFTNIGIICNEPAGSNVTPSSGDMAICLYFENTAEVSQPSDSYRVTMTPLINNIVDASIGTNYVLAGNEEGDFVESITGTPYSFSTEVIPKNGYTLTGYSATNPAGFIGDDNSEVSQTIEGTIEQIVQDTYDVTLTPFTNNIVGTEYTLIGDAEGTVRSGFSGTPYQFNTVIRPDTGYILENGSVTNPGGTITADESVEQVLAGNIVLKDTKPDTVTITLSPFNDNIQTPATRTEESVGGAGLGPDTDSSSFYSLRGDLAGATQVVQTGQPYGFTTTVELAAGYEWTSGPTITNPSGTAPGGDVSVEQTIAGTISAIAAERFTITMTPVTDNIITPQQRGEDTGDTSSFYTLTGDRNGATVIGSPGDSYSFQTGINVANGYNIVGFNATNPSGTIGTADLNRPQTLSGEIFENAAETVTVTLKLSDTIADTNPPHYQLYGDSNGATVTGAPGTPYSFTTNINVDEGYSINNFNATNPSGLLPATSQFVDSTVTGTIVEDTANTYTVTVSWQVNILEGTGNDIGGGGSSSFGPQQTPYVITGDNNGASVTGVPGTPYSFENVVTANPGFEFSEGPFTTNPSGFIGNSNQVVQQVFSGIVVESSAPPADPGQVWKFEPGVGIQGDGISGTYYDTNGQQVNFFVQGSANAGPTCICIGPNLSVAGNPYEPTIYDISPDAIAYPVLENGEPISCNNSLSSMTCPI